MPRPATLYTGRKRFRRIMRWIPSVTVSALCAYVAAAADVPWLEDLGTATGVNFVLENEPTEDKVMIETMTGGVALLDYDNDGKLDVYFVNGAEHGSLKKSAEQYHNRLYRNLGGWKFEDVTEKTGVAGRGYGMGVAAADYDNDGHADLYLPGVNTNILYRNRGDGTFADATEEAGVGGLRRDGRKQWSVAAAWLDYDNDGWLDLFVVNYLVWSYELEVFCGDKTTGLRTYCHPKYYAGLPNTLYRNNGDGTFTDVSEASGVAAHVGKGMAVAVADFNLDGYPDIFVTNDTLPNFLYRNEGDGTFSEVALEAGVAFNDDGRALSSMGVEFRDFDDDGLPDILVTALTNETFPLFQNLGDGLFIDVTYPTQLGTLTLDRGGWGCGIFDLDNDGRKDLFIANGDVQNNVEQYSSRKSRQPNSVLLGEADGPFRDGAARAGIMDDLGQHRGAGFGDLNRDGSIDIVVSRLGEPARVYRNTQSNNWLIIDLEGTKSNRDGIGARVQCATPDGRRQWNHLSTSLGYGSSSASTVHFGLGANPAVSELEIHWPSGEVQRITDIEANRYLTVREP